MKWNSVLKKYPKESTQCLIRYSFRDCEYFEFAYYIGNKLFLTNRLSEENTKYITHWAILKSPYPQYWKDGISTTCRRIDYNFIPKMKDKTRMEKEEIKLY